MRRILATCAAALLAAPARPAAAQAPADAAEKARTLIREKWEARTAELPKIADRDRDGALAKGEFDPLWNAAEQEKREIVRAVCAALGVKEADPKKPAHAGQAAGKGGKKGGRKGGGKGGGKKGGGKADPAKTEADRQARIDDAFHRADTDGDGKVTPDEATGALLGIQADNEPIGG